MAICAACTVLGVLLVMTLQLKSFASACSGRQIYNSSSGIITSGTGEYPASANCEWLIIGGNQKFISLEFIKMVTECSYDYMFVYDGASYNSPLLGTFSGSTLPSTLLAKSGNMLVYFFSDRNYVLQGFHVRYSVTDCPLNCSGHGECQSGKHVCICFAGYVGLACEQPLCAELCQDNGGQCSDAGCDCPPGQIGYDCGLIPNSSSKVGYWSQLLPNGGTLFSARTGHAGAMSQGCLYIFGGTSLNNFLSDLVVYCTIESSNWRRVARSTPWPSARYGHDMAVINNTLYMFGGVLSNGSYSNELWSFVTSRSRWSLLASSSNKTIPPGMTGHTLTVVDNMWLYVMGGRTWHGEFVSSIYRIQVRGSANASWQKVQSVGGKKSARRFVGHSAVFHSNSRSILVFGGFWPEYARFPRRSAMLISYNVDANHWSELNYDITLPAVPRERAFHKAVILGNYMVIHGGQVHLHHEDETCYDQQIYLYHLGCHVWVDYTNMVQPFMDQQIIQRQQFATGRYGHVMVSAFNNTLIVAGGYHGSVLDDLVATTVPISIAMPQSAGTSSPRPVDHCNNYSLGSCNVDPECFWCVERNSARGPGCVHLSRASDCNSGVHSSGCPGICSVLKTCDACTVNGALGNASLARGLPFNDNCFWCVKEAQCQSYRAPGGVCSTSRNTTSGVEGWWSGLSRRLTSLHQCYTDDFPAGLHWIRYRHPANYSMPDEVDVIRSANQNFQFAPVFDGENIADTYYTAFFKGFIHCSRATTNKPPLRVFLVAAAAHAYLYLSRNSSPSDKELVASLDLSTFGYEMAKRANDSLLFPQWPTSCRTYVEEEVVQTVAGRYNTQVASTMQLDWTGALKNTNAARQTISAEFLEPFSSSGSACSGYSTCLACSTDTACGWCDSDTSSSCIIRSSASVDHCVASGASLVLNSMHCPVCADHVDCNSCVQDSSCEWLTSEARCLRRGRFSLAVTEISLCPAPCLERTNLTWCIGDHNECAWCEQTQLCFAFYEYVPRYPYGGCRHWTDGVSSVDVSSDSCSQSTDCNHCLIHFTCGWCFNVDNPTIGVCLRGDFTGPYVSTNCSALISEQHSISEPASWSYASCPDVDECRLGINNCSVDATCHNTIDSFYCTCKKGFAGDGVTTCNRTCYDDCIEGLCSGWPNYTCVCNIGWTGVDCSTDCGCNNHSTCSNGVNECDQCLGWTTGVHCELCQSGSYGNATSSEGCRPCDCNGHGDITKGICDIQSGSCFCIHNTRGLNCEQCTEGHYGNPNSGGQCYRLCDGRTFISNISSIGGLGSYHGLAADNRSQTYCLWILTTFPTVESYDVPVLAGSMSLRVPRITLKLETDLNEYCSQGYVLVYDGIPSYPGFTTSGATLLAVFCGVNSFSTIEVTATSGFMSVFYEAYVDPGSIPVGFNATYRVSQCTSDWDCSEDAACESGVCSCDNGQTGNECNAITCPLSCSSESGHGLCHKYGFCVCTAGYGGLGCSVKQSSSSAVSSLLPSPPSVVLPRVGHSLVSCGDDSTALYLFGGYLPGQGSQNNLWKFDVVNIQWDLVLPNTTSVPSGRYYHAAVCVPAERAIIVHGGIVDQFSVSQELWKYSLDDDMWIRIVSSGSQPPAMAGHTMTLTAEKKIWIVGGFSPFSYFIESVYVLNLNDGGAVWTEVMGQHGTKPVGLYGHSAVYHKLSKAIYVHGGYEYATDRAVVSSNLYVLDVGGATDLNSSWTMLPPDSNNRPPARYFHGSISTDQYMVVLGGYSSDGSVDTSIFIYHYACNHWTNMTSLVDTATGDQAWTFHTTGQAAVALDGSIYQLSGWMMAVGSMSLKAMVRLNLPSDICGLNHNDQSCINTVGCAVCFVTETQSFFCYSDTGSRPPGCRIRNTTITMQQGVVCNAQRIEARDCSQYQTCSECLGRWPLFPGLSQSCQWCTRCSPVRCVPYNTDCDKSSSCAERQQRVLSPSDCLERQCQASDCEKCANKGNCIWTRQVKRTSENGRNLNLVPIYDWNCVAKGLDGLPFKIEASPPLKCPARCYQHTSCTSCLSSQGGEGGAHECSWSVLLHRCVAPAYLPLLCSAGECGLVTFGNELQCPLPCRVNTQCATCLATPRCGWCALGSLNGRGLCMEGGPGGPVAGICSNATVFLYNESLSDNVVGWLQQARPPNVWSFSSCPLENECTNGHHSCGTNEQCIDAIDGFSCECKTGFARNSRNICEPLCKQGCQYGTCVLPDTCQCNFGYVGANCSTECQCNKHSNCASVTERNLCLSCQNNTIGPQCDFCKYLFIGNPKNGGNCQSCSDLCNSHSQVCLAIDDQNDFGNSTGSSFDAFSVRKSLKYGPLDKSNAVCINCADNTQGNHCQECKYGHFRLKSRPLSEACQICQCNGHSDVCDKERGENCDCKNNTRSPRCENGENTKQPCWKNQCSQCLDTFLGTPTVGHQCYRPMTLDTGLCFDPVSQKNCSPASAQPNPLYANRTVFFAVQPKYLNVDIRIILDVTKGAVTLYFAPYDNVFVVTVDPLTGVHRVTIDRTYRYTASTNVDDSENVVTHSRRRRRRGVNESSGGEGSDDIDLSNISSNSSASGAQGGSESDESDKIYQLVELKARQFVTYVAVPHPDTFLIVRDVRDRLVIMLPNAVHQLKVSRFYLVIVGASTSVDSASFGMVYFRQDQPHIDLFVFFSVFFSCFFLFLAICVLLWKAKQVVDARRTHLRRQIEMQCMASRPFARALVHFGASSRPTLMLARADEPVTTLTRMRSSKQKHASVLADDTPFNVNPLALEPTNNGSAVVATFVVELPCSATAPVRACLGSCLLMPRVVYATSVHHTSTKNGSTRVTRLATT